MSRLARPSSAAGGIAAWLLFASLFASIAAAKEVEWSDVPMTNAAIAAKLRYAARNRHPDIGLPHLVFTLDPRSCGVKMPDDLREKYPTALTIVLQYQFERLTVAADHFAVDLWFSGKRRRLSVPFSALSGFWDHASRERAGFVPKGPCAGA